MCKFPKSHYHGRGGGGGGCCSQSSPGRGQRKRTEPAGKREVRLRKGLPCKKGLGSRRGREYISLRCLHAQETLVQATHLGPGPGPGQDGL